ncbi:hypothetical protein RSSM_03962 [Rhodopirellula sallentina SM41]|uniref:Uncharacterized protein n=1 Tax=Rhodopirellula sallentina SM41 TaxID=1263870 RepID=M5U9R5_9BACT|nr:hypothetical protein RSSM_03962 [Rhodopirellula sallentina SM41]
MNSLVASTLCWSSLSRTILVPIVAALRVEKDSGFEFNAVPHPAILG